MTFLHMVISLRMMGLWRNPGDAAMEALFNGRGRLQDDRKRAFKSKSSSLFRRRPPIAIKIMTVIGVRVPVFGSLGGRARNYLAKSRRPS